MSFPSDTSQQLGSFPQQQYHASSMNLPSELIAHVIGFCDVQSCLSLRLVCRAFNNYATPHAMRALHLTVDLSEYVDGHFPPEHAIKYTRITKTLRLTVLQVCSTQNTIWPFTWHRIINIRRWASPQAMRSVIEPYKGLFERLEELDVSSRMSSYGGKYKSHQIKITMPGHSEGGRPDSILAIRSGINVRMLTMKNNPTFRPEHMRAILRPDSSTWLKLRVLKLTFTVMQKCNLLEFLEAHSGTLRNLTLHHAKIRKGRDYDCAPSINELMKRVCLERLEVRVIDNSVLGGPGRLCDMTVKCIENLSWGQSETVLSPGEGRKTQCLVVRKAIKQGTTSEVTDS